MGKDDFGWQALAQDFRKFHTHPLNVALHLVTTPCALFAASVLIVQFLGTEACAAAHAVWMLSIVFNVPLRLWLASAVTHGLLAAAAVASVTSFSPLSASALFAVAYFSQDVAHLATCETTFQSSYQGSTGWIWRLLAHTLHLTPLCIDACWHTKGGSLAMLFTARRQLAYKKLDASKEGEAELLDAAKRVGAWAIKQDPPTHCTTHWWWYNLPSKEREAFRQVATSAQMKDDLFGELYPPATHVVDPLEGMNEVYVACKTHNNNSDTTFYRDHVDGPYGLFPLVHVYRMMLGCMSCACACACPCARPCAPPCAYPCAPPCACACACGAGSNRDGVPCHAAPPLWPLRAHVTPVPPRPTAFAAARRSSRLRRSSLWLASGTH